MATVQETVDLFAADAMAGTVGTRVTYRAALMALMAFLTERQVDVAGEVDRALNVRLLLDWATWLLAERQIAPRTLMLYLAALASYVKWLQVTGRWTLDGRDVLAFGAGMKQIRKMQRPARGRPHPPTGDEVGRILRAAREVAPAADDARGRLMRLRDTALVEVLRCTGLRASEILSLRRKQLRQDGGYHAWVIGKGRKEREVFFDEAAWQAVQRLYDGGGGGRRVRLRASPHLTKTQPDLRCQSPRAAYPTAHDSQHTPAAPNAVPAAFARRQNHRTPDGTSRTQDA